MMGIVTYNNFNEAPVQPETRFIFRTQAHTYAITYSVRTVGGTEIDWGDGSPVEVSGGGILNHTYPSGGPYTCAIALAEDPGVDHFWIYGPTVEVLSWGETPFMGVSFRESVTVAVPDYLPQWVTSMYQMFHSVFSVSQSIREWETHNVTSLKEAFYGCTALGSWPNLDLDRWDTSNVTDMYGTFAYATPREFVGDWDVSSVTDMGYMFEGSGVDADLSRWDVSAVTNMDRMFYEASMFNQDLSGWCVAAIPTPPTDFDTDAWSWALPRPVWGTCP